jgi:RNA polymerase sigma factor (sigma-70 family)
VDADSLADRFEENRDHLRAVAHRILGSLSEADDAVQEVWLRLVRSDSGDIENLSGWLTTVVARVCLDMVRSRKLRREEPLDAWMAEPVVIGAEASEPEQNALLADSVGWAMQVVLDTLTPPERLAYVLHDIFGVPFNEIAPIVERSPAATRKLASRARRRVEATGTVSETNLALQYKVVSAFLTAARDGDFAALITVLDPDVVLRTDEVAAAESLAPRELRGVREVASALAGRAQGLRLALVDGVMAAAWVPGGRPRRIFSFVIADGKIVEIEIVGDPTRLEKHDVALLNA